jgi:ABC-type multidrug transport system ATPase subunit
MKQRLGVAAALLKDPKLLILDEPTNGLDPKGMADMRALVRALGSGERTVLLSSHLLGEVEQICDRVGVIHKGILVAEGTIAELWGEEGLLVRAEPFEEARQIAERLKGVEGVRVTDGMLRLATDPGRAAEINAKLVSAGLRGSELRPAEQSLEEVFLELTGGGRRSSGVELSGRVPQASQAPGHVGSGSRMGDPRDPVRLPPHLLVRLRPGRCAPRAEDPARSLQR